MTKAAKREITTRIRRELHVPDWFICGGCSGPAFDTTWTRGCCDRHDFDYWQGATTEDAKQIRAMADSFLQVNIEFYASHINRNWVDKLIPWRKPWGKFFFMAVTTFGKSSFTIRSEEQRWEMVKARLDGDDSYLKIVAYVEGRYDQNGDSGPIDVVKEIRTLRADGMARRTEF